MKWIVSALVLLLGKLPRLGGRRRERERIVEPTASNPRAELVAGFLLFASAACAVAFVVVYALDGIHHQTQYLGLALGAAFALAAIACVILAQQVIATEDLSHPYPPVEHEEAQEDFEQIVEEAGQPITRKRLLLLGAGAAGTALGAALLAPAASLGPVLDSEQLLRTPWRRGRLLVDEAGHALLARDVEPESFYTAYPVHADREQMGAPLVVIRLDPAELDLPPERAGWAPGGIMAFSKICTHAGCAVSEYRYPSYGPTAPGPAVVCPCHYSTFSVTEGGKRIFGPAGRALPQLPLAIDGNGYLVAAGDFSGRPGPSWWGVRK